MKLIHLNHGYVSKVDDADYDWLNKSTWCIAKRNGVIYACTSRKINGVWQPVFMHTLIMNTPKGKRIDHRDTDGLNNQRKNLRECNASQNAMNGDSKKGYSQYRGVSVRNRVPSKKDPLGTRRRYLARIMVNRKEHFIGQFKTEEEAARAWNRAAIQYFGEFAKLNNV